MTQNTTHMNSVELCCLKHRIYENVAQKKTQKNTKSKIENENEDKLSKKSGKISKLAYLEKKLYTKRTDSTTN